MQLKATAPDIPPHILVVDDDERLRELICSYLQDHRFITTWATDAADAQSKLDYFTYDALVLDVMMPGKTGFEWAQYCREENISLPPILFLTAMSESEDRITGLESGAQDYLTKPFEPRELVLRLQNVIGRGSAAPVQKNKQEQVRFGEWVFTLDTAQLSHEGETEYLTTAEAQCLKVLAEKSPKAVTREAIAEAMAEGNDVPNPRSVDVLMNRLRKKIEPRAGRPIYLQTVRGAGYALIAEYL